VGDYDHGDLTMKSIQGIDQCALGLRIEGAGCLVEDEEGGVVVEGAGEANALALTAGHADPAFAGDGLETLGELGLNEVEDLGDAADLLEPFPADFFIGQAEGNIAGKGLIEENDILGHIADACAP